MPHGGYHGTIIGLGSKPKTGTTGGPAGMGSPPPKPKPKPKPKDTNTDTDTDKKDKDKKTFVDRYKKATTLGLSSGALLGASLGTRKYQQIQDIRKINKWADRTSRMFGKTYKELGRKVNPALMARASGQFIPSNIYAKTGYPGELVIGGINEVRQHILRVLKNLLIPF